MLKNAGIDPKKEVREYLQTLARIAEKKRIAKELRTERVGATNMKKVVNGSEKTGKDSGGQLGSSSS